jgi:hypothetical protein
VSQLQIAAQMTEKRWVRPARAGADLVAPIISNI